MPNRTHYVVVEHGTVVENGQHRRLHTDETVHQLFLDMMMQCLSDIPSMCIAGLHDSNNLKGFEDCLQRDVRPPIAASYVVILNHREL